MRLTRVHVEGPLAAGAKTLIEGDAAAHVTRVLRLRAGDALTLFDGRGGEYAARIAGPTRGGIFVEVGEHRPIERESPLDLTLLQAIARGERMDLVVQKTTELGVTRIVPVLSERTVVRLDASQAARKLAHWRAIAVAACEQCGRNRLPEILEPRSFAEALVPHAKQQAADALTIVLDPAAEATLAERTRGGTKIVLLVGPEGGFTDGELELAARAGFAACRMGARVLRAETAAIACVAAIETMAGDLGA